MTYEEIWQKIRRMSQHNRKHLAYEMTLVGLSVGYIHPHYYFDAKAVHDILFYPSGSQHETEDKDGTYYNTLKEIVENDEEIHVRVKRYPWLPRFINDWREGEIVKSYICSRYNGEWLNGLGVIVEGTFEFLLRYHLEWHVVVEHIQSPLGAHQYAVSVIHTLQSLYRYSTWLP